MQLVVIQKESLIKRIGIPVLTGLLGLGVGFGAGRMSSPGQENPAQPSLQSSASDKSDANPALRRANLSAADLRRLELDIFAELAKGTQKRADIEDDIRRALSLGINPNAMPGDNSAPLLIKCIQAGCSPDMVQALLQAGADPNSRSSDQTSAVSVAVGMHALETLKILLQAEADPMLAKNSGATPLHDAVWVNDTKCLKALLPYYKKCNFSPWGGPNDRVPYMIINLMRPYMMQSLIEAGMNVNDPMFAEEPLLIRAVKMNRPYIVELLLQAGADKNARDKDGKRAIDYAKDETMAEKLR